MAGTVHVYEFGQTPWRGERGSARLSECPQGVTVNTLSFRTPFAVALIVTSVAIETFRVLILKVADVAP